MNTVRIFPVGEIAAGDSFIGRETELSDLSTIFYGTGSVHLIGAARIGKSSLMRQVFNKYASNDATLILEFCLSEYTSAYHFWYSFWTAICEEIRRVDIWNDVFECYCSKLNAASDDSVNWYIKMATPLQGMLKELKKTKYRIVVAIDEFDAVTRVFEGQSAYYQLLRSLFSDGKYAMNGVIASRRNLDVLEAKAPDISTFHGVFRTLRLREFDKYSMEVFYKLLNKCGISLSLENKQYLSSYTGNMPYLCCMFADKMTALHKDDSVLEVSSDIIYDIYRLLQSDIQRYYEDLIVRLEEDGHLEPLIYLSFDEMRTLSYQRNRDNMISMGYLTEVKINDQYSYYAYSPDFMKYLRYKPSKLSTWDLMTASERKLKNIFGKVYPKTHQVFYEGKRCNHLKAVEADVDAEYPELRIKWTQMEEYSRTLAWFKDNPTVLDVLTLPFVINVMINQWDSQFGGYFNWDSGWKPKLGKIKELRNPLAHAHGEYINEEDLNSCNRYCEDLQKLEINL